MNPYYDLVVIGIIVLMVLMNLYYSRQQSDQATSLFSEFREKLASFNLLAPKSVVHHQASAHMSLK